MRQLFYSEKNQHFWLVTANNKIYEIESHKEESLVSKHNIYLREIRKQNNILLPDPKLDVELQGSALTFSFIQPDYSGLMGIEYQYKLAGLMDSWSNWDSQNNIFTFSYLPAGLYQLEFKTKNIFGNEKSIVPIEFKIIAPYWRRPWFYAMEVAFFTTLLILSIRLNRANTRYRVVSRLLAFLTLILIVEFVQTVVEYKFETDASPVIDFFIQVSIALLVLPVERILRKALFSTNNAESLIALKDVSSPEKRLKTKLKK